MAAKIRVKLHFLGIILQNAYSFYMAIFNFLFVCCQYKIFAKVDFKFYRTGDFDLRDVTTMMLIIWICHYRNTL